MTEDTKPVSSGIHSCILVDPTAGPMTVAVLQVDAKEAQLSCERVFEKNEYIDAALERGDGQRHNVFAHVIESGDGTLRLRWLHFDPSEETRLLGFLNGSPASGTTPPAAAAQASGTSGRQTRKVIRPTTGRGEADITPFSVSVVPEELPGPSASSRTRKVVKPRTGTDAAEIQALGVGAKAPEEGSRRTRKIVRPTQLPTDTAKVSSERHQTVRPFEAAEYAPSDSAPGKGSSTTRPALPTEDAHDLVLAPTGRHETGGGESAEGGENTNRLTKRQNIIGTDGKLDVGATIRSKAKTVSAAELAARHDQVRVLNMKTIKGLIQDAVAEAVTHLSSQLEEGERKRLLEEAEEQFQERLKAFNAENKGLQAQADVLKGQLSRAEKLLEDERHRQIQATQFTVSDAGIADMEKRFERIVSRVARDGKAGAEVEQELKNLVSKLLDEEREHIAEQAKKAQSDAIALLEKKVGRLSKSLEDTERERDRAHRQMQAMSANGGGFALANVMEAGLDEDDPSREQKLNLLKDIFDQNKALRESLKSAGIEVKSKRRKPKAEAAPAGKPEPEPERAKPAVAEPDAEPAAAPLVAEAAATPGASSTAQPSPEAETEAASDSTESEVDPDDMVWKPGMSFAREPGLDDEDDHDDDAGVPKMTKFKAFGPPPLQRSAPAKAPAAPAAEAKPSAGGQDGPTRTDSSELEDLSTELGEDPDDAPWQPSAASDADENADDNGPVKKVTGFKNFKPPPLNR